MKTKSLAIVTAGFLAALISASGEDTPAPLVDYRFCSIPFDRRTTPYRWLDWPYIQRSIGDVTDSSLSTFTHAAGLDGTNGIDTGTFSLFQFQIDPSAGFFTIEFTGKLQYYASRPVEFMVTLPEPYLQGAGYFSNVSEPTTFGMTFFRDGGNSTGSPWGLFDIMNLDGRVTIGLLGGFLAAVDRPGVLTSDLYEVRASYGVVPEPSVWVLMAIGAFGLAFALRRRNDHAAS